MQKVQGLSLNALSMAFTWYTLFTHRSCVVLTHGTFMVLTWYLHGILMVGEWYSHGMCMASEWYSHGIHMVHAW